MIKWPLLGGFYKVSGAYVAIDKVSGAYVAIDKVSDHRALMHLNLKSMWAARVLRTFQTDPFYFRY